MPSGMYYHGKRVPSGMYYHGRECLVVCTIMEESA